ncbi:hypothetical protein [Pseudogulbenkiania ferrooxidans]|uniref:Uncharacterized protein n=1 Tax=Pseudogulbenkiania ferrooxidans 2002 TaxID=279714 RepID=B9Z500_9NEIS|nr:hypothetical protein [Pseudogulbenkiania ferrooxidans]EEG08232.1 hypothetical protein FuraDRAFT_2435 [Pseudogulbenkiania ferrooxidans 2002]
MSDPITRALDGLTAGLTAALPDRIVSDQFVDHPGRHRDELERGVVCLLLPSGQLPSEWETELKLTLVGQLAVPERGGTTRQVRDAELELLQQLLAFTRNPGADVPRLNVKGFRTSSQMEFPFGWVALEVTAGPLDLADGTDGEIYPPSTSIGTLRTAHIDIDIPPHVSAAEHQKWLDGDYSTSTPEMQTHVELNP